MKFLDWYKHYRLDLIAAKSAATNRPYTAMLEMVTKQSEFMNQWLNGFKTTDLPQTTVVREFDEWQAEQDRGVATSFDNAAKAGVSFPDLRELLEDVD